MGGFLLGGGWVGGSFGGSGGCGVWSLGGGDGRMVYTGKRAGGIRLLDRRLSLRLRLWLRVENACLMWGLGDSVMELG